MKKYLIPFYILHEKIILFLGLTSNHGSYLRKTNLWI